jgi:hypothetical protein
MRTKASHPALREDPGQVAAVFVVFALGLMVVVGLISDGGMLLAARRNLLHLADGAARAGATAVDPATIRQTADGTVDPEAARAAVSRYLDLAGFTGQVEVVPAPDGVSVRLAEEQHPMFGRLFGISTTTIVAESRAAPRARE